MKSFLISLIVLLNIQLFSQTIINENTKAGYWKVCDSTIVWNQKFEELKVGYWKYNWFLLSKRVRKVSFYDKNGLKSGREVKFYFDGEPRVIGNYEKGEKHCIFWYPTKDIKSFFDIIFRVGINEKRLIYLNGEFITKNPSYDEMSKLPCKNK